MADMPDLDTSDVNLMAYYNVIDENDVTSIDVDSALTYGSLNSYTLYDNGWAGTADSVTGSDWHIRFKNDGWLVIYLDRQSNMGQNVSLDNVRGLGTLVGTDGSHSSPSNNYATETIDGILNNLDSSDNIVYNGGDEKFYCYATPDATHIGIYGGSGVGQHNLSFSTGTTVHQATIGGSGAYYNSDAESRVKLDGNTIIGPNDTGIVNIGDIDPETSHTAAIQSNGYDATGGLVFLYS